MFSIKGYIGNVLGFTGHIQSLLMFFDFLQSFKNIKAILSSWAIQKQITARTWPLGHSLLTPGLEHHCPVWWTLTMCD